MEPRYFFSFFPHFSTENLPFVVSSIDGLGIEGVGNSIVCRLLNASTDTDGTFRLTRVVFASLEIHRVLRERLAFYCFDIKKSYVLGRESWPWRRDRIGFRVESRDSSTLVAPRRRARDI